MRKLFGWIDRGAEVGVAAIFAAMCAIGLLQVFNRFVLNNLNGNGGNIGLTLEATTGANTVVLPRSNTSSVIDNGNFDCDGDG